MASLLSKLKFLPVQKKFLKALLKQVLWLPTIWYFFWAMYDETISFNWVYYGAISALNWMMLMISVIGAALINFLMDNPALLSGFKLSSLKIEFPKSNKPRAEPKIKEKEKKKDSEAKLPLY